MGGARNTLPLLFAFVKVQLVYNFFAADDIDAVRQ